MFQPYSTVQRAIDIFNDGKILPTSYENEAKSLNCTSRFVIDDTFGLVAPS